MLKLQVRRWSERPRVLVLMLAIMLPAAALIVASAWHLHTLQREKGVEAVIQRDYQHVLAIAEKRIDDRAFEARIDRAVRMRVIAENPHPQDRRTLRRSPRDCRSTRPPPRALIHAPRGR